MWIVGIEPITCQLKYLTRFHDVFILVYENYKSKTKPVSVTRFQLYSDNRRLGINVIHKIRIELMKTLWKRAMLPLHHMCFTCYLYPYIYVSWGQGVLHLTHCSLATRLYTLHSAGIEPAICSSEVRRVTNYARSAPPPSHQITT